MEKEYEEQSMKEQGQREKVGIGEKNNTRGSFVDARQNYPRIFSCFTLIFPPHSQGTGYTD